MAIVLGKTELILICLVAVALLALVVRKIQIPHAILLTCGGVVPALIPGLPAIQLEPQVVFNLFLPPLIYTAALFTSWRDLRASLRPILLQQKKIDERQASISQLKSEMQTMVGQLKEQTAQIQKVSAELEVNKASPQTVANK